MYTVDTVASMLKSAGWREHKTTRISSANRHWQMRVDTIAKLGSPTVCTCNKKLHINIEYYAMMSDHESYTIDICAEVNDQDWVKLDIYGLTHYDIFNRLDELTMRLVLAWQAACMPIDELEQQIVYNAVKS